MYNLPSGTAVVEDQWVNYVKCAVVMQFFKKSAPWVVLCMGKHAFWGNAHALPRHSQSLLPTPMHTTLFYLHDNPASLPTPMHTPFHLLDNPASLDSSGWSQFFIGLSVFYTELSKPHFCQEAQTEVALRKSRLGSATFGSTKALSLESSASRTHTFFFGAFVGLHLQKERHCELQTILCPVCTRLFFTW